MNEKRSAEFPPRYPLLWQWFVTTGLGERGGDYRLMEYGGGGGILNICSPVGDLFRRIPWAGFHKIFVVRQQKLVVIICPWKCVNKCFAGILSIYT